MYMSDASSGSTVVEVECECKVYPSEDPNKVMKAIKNVIDGIEPVHEDDMVKARAVLSIDALAKMKRQIQSRQVMDTFRRIMLENEGEDGYSTWLYLNKQAAYAGSIVVCEDEDESPLGPIRVTIRSRGMKVRRIIDWLTR
ncbi:MAG: RNA-binding domain-containing protein [Candidatus Nitrosocaldus sp.]